MPSPIRPARLAPLALALAAALPPAEAQPTVDLGRYFGFDEPHLLVADEGVGPVVVADINADGRLDILAVNNRKSRIELNLQRPRPLSDEEVAKVYKVNEFPPSRFYERKEVSVAHQVTALVPFDFDGDGKLDIVYAGRPEEIVCLRQGENLAFETTARRREKGLASTRSSFAIADVMGDDRPEVLASVNGRIHVYPFSRSGVLAQPVMLGVGGAKQSIAAFFVEDYDGDGLKDVLAAIPEDSAPLRLWRQESASAAAPGKDGVLGPELRFEMPGLREVDPVRFPGRTAASIGVIERASRRIVFYDLAEQQIDASPASPGSEREAQAEVRTFEDATGEPRSVVVADVDSDGDLDLLAAGPTSNQLVLYRQRAGAGLSVGETFSSFRKPKTVAVGAWDQGAAPKVFTLSEEEKAVGVSAVDHETGRIGFPEPLQLVTPGSTPVAMGHVMLGDAPALAIVVKDKRDHTIEIHFPGAKSSENYAVALEGVKRPPQSVLAADLDHDGVMELLLLTPGEPMIIVRPKSGGGEAKVLTEKTMPQFGLVQAAGPDNTALLDVDNDGRLELLIADRNYVRACEFRPDTGWRVVDQATVPNPATAFNSITIVPGAAGGPGAILAYDKASGRLTRFEQQQGGWRATDALRVPGFEASSIYAGSFTGDGKPGLLAVGADGFGIVRFAGERATLESFAAYRSDAENRLEHELSVGDLNGDGYTDVVVLDAKEQMCQILTFSAARKIVPATEFEVFQSRLFTRGEGREFEPSDALIADVTGDGAQDLILIVHDRVIVYPQMTSPR